MAETLLKHHTSPGDPLTTLLTTMFPVFGLMALGFVTAKLRAMDAGGVRGLVLFVFNFAIPALLLRSLATVELPANTEWGVLIAFYVGAVATYALGMAAGKILFGRALPEQPGSLRGICPRVGPARSRAAVAQQVRFPGGRHAGAPRGERRRRCQRG